MPIEISNFFKSYIRGFDKLDPTSIAAHYHENSSIADATGLNNFNSHQQICAKIDTYCSGFQASGYSGARYSCDHYQSLGENSCFVDLYWTIKLANSDLEYKTAYMLHKDADTWKIGSAVVYGY